MADSQDTQHQSTHANTSIASPASRHNDTYNPLEDLREQAYESDPHGRFGNTGEIAPPYNDDDRAARGASPSISTLSAVEAAFREGSTTALVQDYRPAVAHTSNPERVQHNDTRAPRPDVFADLHPADEDTVLDPSDSLNLPLSTKDEFRPDKDCPTRRNFRSSRLTWLSGTIIFISSVATALSALFVVLALKGQRYRNYIGTGPEAKISISAAILWTSVVAKTIELSFVTAFVAFLGQKISRRAMADSKGRGVSISELSMWRWVVQPGSLVTSSEIARYAGFSALGTLTLLSTILSTLYVTAATALVQPVAKHGDWHDKTMVSSVQTDFANINYVQSLCQTPVPDEEASMWCMDSESAARDQRNNMPQSEMSDTIAPYSLWASVPSPVMKVLCVHMNETELQPIIYEAWPNRGLDSEAWAIGSGPRDNATTANETVVDELFGWTKKDTDHMLDFPPVFARYPRPFNTIINNTAWAWGRPAIYLLGQSGPVEGVLSDLTGVYPLCKLQVEITSHCSTTHSVSVSESAAEALCGDRASDMAYFKNAENATDNTTTRVLYNWKDMATLWANSISLDGGLTYSNATFQRTLMNLALKPEDSNPANFQVQLNPPPLPSLAETLAVMASDSIPMSLRDGPFVTHWNYTHPNLDEPQTQWFRAKIKSQEYASGGVDNASKGWLLILIATFLLNFFLLSYFILQPGFVTDFTQPAQLFALAVNSPPAQALAGSCGGGPEGKDYKFGWFINHEAGHVYIEPASRTEPTSLNDEHVRNRIVAASKEYWKTLTRRAVWGRSKPNKEPRTGGATSASDTEPLQPSRNTQSVLLTHSRCSHLPHLSTIPRYALHLTGLYVNEGLEEAVMTFTGRC
ncbi:uncharacterized protein M421DRAFT_96269 [Didymella exigua CBS 183.55]|uniref:Uncharacterized protein n=1 Tax=Didymella exigua CBS 183.55 TaxID=1150837 RepID=A0A6A5R7T5_9PLEO|nr:uncharacterized protein M421DRAFT_96269 [Didymella exigua CBS 183.55]KAF1923228.1 hypothetical protein M421DRAFT_96269 [Didymella exigua CBS 183.55]